MNCPHCHQPLPDPTAATCPHCGEPLLSASQEDPLAGPTVLQGPDETPTVVPSAPQDAPDAEQERPEWNQPSASDASDTLSDGETTRPDWNQPLANSPVDTTDSAETVAYTPPSDETPASPAPPAEPTAEALADVDTVAYTPPADQPPTYTPPVEPPPQAYTPPAYTPPVEAPPPAYTPPTYTPPAELPAMYPAPDSALEPPTYTPPQEPLYISPAADQLPETVAYTPPTAPEAPTPPAPQPPAEQPPAYIPPMATPPTYTPPVGQPPTYTPPAPMYAPPQQPPYQTGSPASGQPWTGQAQAPQKKSRAGCVIGCLLVLVLLVGLVGGGYVFLKNQANGITVAGLTIGGNTTGPGGGALIYQDALNGSTKSQWTDDSNCFFGAGGYHINAGFICYAPADNVGDAVTSVSVKQISGPITYGYGLVIRRLSKGNYYTFEVNANGKWRFAKVVNGTSTDIANFATNAAIKTGLNQVNTLSVTAKGSHFVFSVNGAQVGVADDSTFTSGDTGLVGNDGIEVVFSNLSIAHLKS